MKHLGNTNRLTGFNQNSRSNLKRLGAILLSVGLLTACSTKIATDTSGASVSDLNTTGTTDYDYTNDFSDTGTDTSTPTVDTSTPTNTTTSPTTPNYTSPIRCYISRQGGYYYTGMPVAWEFGTDTGEELEVINITSSVPWTTQPQFPIAPSFTISFQSSGWKNLSFTVRSRSNPSRVCNGGRAVNDRIYINYGYYGW